MLEKEEKKKKEKNIHPSTKSREIDSFSFLFFFLLAKEKETRASQFLLHLFSASLRGISLLASARQLTNFFRLIIFNDLGQLHVPSDHRHLVGSLVRVIQAVLLRASEQQLAYARRVRVVHSAYVQRRVAGRVTRVHVGTVKEQVIQVLDQVVAAGLRTCEGGARRGGGGGEEFYVIDYRKTRGCAIIIIKLSPLSPSVLQTTLSSPFFSNKRRGQSSYRKKKEKREEGRETEKGEKVKSET